jgi:hypothetical protein
VELEEQRTRGAYVATICQPEAAFDLSIATQSQEPSDEDIKKLNKRLQWLIDNSRNGLQYIPLDLGRTKLFVFVDGSLANNQDYSSQLGYIILIGTEEPSTSYQKESAITIIGNVVQ